MSMKKNGKLIKDAELLADTPNKASGESGTPAKKRKFTRKTLIKVMFVISIIFIMISLTYSWFTASNSASISGLDIDVVDPNNLVAGGLTSKGVINSVAGDGTSFFKPVFEQQLIGTNGNFNLYKDVQNGEYEKLDDDVVSLEANVSNIFVQDFTLSIAGKHKIYMVNGTKITSEDSDYLTGGLRVAVLKLNESTSEYELCLVWIPDVMSAKDRNDRLDETVTVVVPDGEGGADVTFTVNSERGTTTANGVRYVWGEITADTNTNVLVGELDGVEKYRIAIWLDGNDRECDKELTDKAITATFQFLPEAIADEAVTE